MILLSIIGLMRTLLIILGVLFLLQIISKTARARKNVANQERMKNEEGKSKSTVNEARRNYGKTSIDKVDKNKLSDNDYTDFEEVD